jgi:hypothetical protein
MSWIWQLVVTDHQITHPTIRQIDDPTNRRIDGPTIRRRTNPIIHQIVLLISRTSVTDVAPAIRGDAAKTRRNDR